MKKAFLILGPVVLAALFFLHQAGNKEIQLQDALLTTRIADLAGQEREVGQWKGKPLVINFWATWCPPCRHEIPDFIAVQQKYSNVQMIGIALDDDDKVRAFSREYHFNYPILVDSAHRMQHLLSGIPFTVMIDKEGKIVDTHVGALSRDMLESKIINLLKIA